jgi:hypothetical protein
LWSVLSYDLPFSWTFSVAAGYVHAPSNNLSDCSLTAELVSLTHWAAAISSSSSSDDDDEMRHLVSSLFQKNKYNKIRSTRCWAMAVHWSVKSKTMASWSLFPVAVALYIRR